MTSPQEKARIEWTLQRLQEEFERLRESGSLAVKIRSSPEAARQLRELSSELLTLSRHPHDGGQA